MPPILFQDDRFVVLDKPAGLPVHPGPRGGPSVEDWFPLLSRRSQGPWLAHRLDADTSGCLLVALRRPALLAAQAEFAAGRVRKAYWAIVRSLAHGGRSRWQDRRHRLARTRSLRRVGLARARAAHRPDAPGAGSLRGARLPGAGRCNLWRGHWQATSAGARDSARSRPSRRCRRIGARAHAGRAYALRLRRGVMAASSPSGRLLKPQCAIRATETERGWLIRRRGRRGLRGPREGQHDASRGAR